MKAIVQTIVRLDKSNQEIQRHLMDGRDSETIRDLVVYFTIYMRCFSRQNISCIAGSVRNTSQVSLKKFL